MRAAYLCPLYFAVLALVSPTSGASARTESGAGMAPCGIPYEPSDQTAMAHAMLFPSSGRTVILYNPRFIGWAERRGLGAAMFRYLMQHECAHHMLGHVTALATGHGMLGAASRHLEVEADCYAAKQLAVGGDMRALQAALMIWNSMGSAATGPYHPIGLERSAKLQSCYIVGRGEPMPGF